MEKYLAIIEVTQKQAYIFGSKKLRDNIARSGVIEMITSERYLIEKYGEFFNRNNLVYSGGGHTILQYDTQEAAKELIMKYSEDIFSMIPDIDVYAKIRKYDENATPGENITELIKALERKKALRRNSFRQGALGIEMLNEDTFKPVLVKDGSGKLMNECAAREGSFEYNGQSYKLPASEQDFAVKIGEQEDNFIAVVHIDGNAMGKRVGELHDEISYMDWDEAAEKLADFSKSIDDDFKSAFDEMLKSVANWIENESLVVRDKSILPVRKLILAGDDVCFITSGCMGISCAVEFIKALAGKTNAVDGKPYYCCAGVAMVHTKYPFYRAYGLSEELCSSAKKYGITLEKDGKLSAIDWHLEYGQLKDSLSEIREDSVTYDGNRLYMKPYVVDCGDASEESIAPYKNIGHYFAVLEQLQNRKRIPRSKVKGLRQSLKEGEVLTDFYIKSNRIDGIINEMLDGKPSFAETEDGIKHCLYYDAIETMDQVMIFKEV